ncbi:rab11 family-interacting protein 5-like [Mytilus californianus]|uniref:rab11 family-interacting protein 5-like n=1 Tax=Mytilus californianus TaxID=6549 RepID=UPI0022464796|nr:rab11 family-interacting protein 5-like [Mytilus californianus]
MTWEPTHVQLTVLRARNLLTKSKGGSKLTDVFVAVQLGKEKFQTSTIKNALNPEWFEQCDLQLPTMNMEVQLHVMHRGMLSDDFIGYCSVPLWHYKVYERPSSQWIQLQGKPNKTPDNKYRGEIEVRVAFSVKSKQEEAASNLNKKKSSSIKGLASAMGQKVGDKFKFVRSKSLRDPHFSTPPAKDPSAFQTTSAIQNERLRACSMSLRRSGEMDKGPDNIRIYNQPGNRQSLPASYLGTQTLPHPKGKRYGQGRRSMDDLDSAVSSQPGYLESIFRKESEVFKTMNTGGHLSDSSESIEEPKSNKVKSAKEYTAPIQESCDSESEGSIDINFPAVKRKSDSVGECKLPSDPKLEQLEEQQSSSSHLNNLSPESGIATINSSHTSISNDNEFKETSFPETSGDPVYHNEVPSSEKLSHTDINGEDRKESVSRSKKKIAPEENFSFGLSPDKLEPTTNGNVRRRSKKERSRGMGNRRYTVQGLDYPRRQNSLEDTLDSLRPQFMREAREVSSIPNDLIAVYRHMTKDELIRIVIQHKAQLIRKDQYVKDLEGYIDSLLVRVMEATPRILQNGTRFK